MRTQRLQWSDDLGYDNSIEINIQLQRVMDQADYKEVVAAASTILGTAGKYIVRPMPMPMPEKKEAKK